MNKNKSSPDTTNVKKRGERKVIRIKNIPSESSSFIRKPKWIKSKPSWSPAVIELKKKLRENKLHTVCEEASCPNLGECFSSGTATFMIMGDICTRRCSFCDVAHGRPSPLDPDEPEHLAKTIQSMELNYVVITSVDRDDLRDGGSQHFVNCIREIRKSNPTIRIEILVPDFLNRMGTALIILSKEVPDVFNHNIETVPRLYRTVRPSANYQHSLMLIKKFKQLNPTVPTKSGLMLGLGEERDEIIQTLYDLKKHDCDMLSLGQYLQPTRHHVSVNRYLTPSEFIELKELALDIGFKDVASGSMVRSSYHADEQFNNSKKIIMSKAAADVPLTLKTRGEK